METINDALRRVFFPRTLAIIFAVFSLFLDYSDFDDKAGVFFICACIMYAAHYICHSIFEVEEDD